MNEYFIKASSFAAPFVSDDWSVYEQGETPEAALESFAANCGHPAGLYAARAYTSADASHKGEKPLAEWTCNHELEKQKLKPEGSYSYLGHGPGDFEINGVRHRVLNPKQGKVVTATASAHQLDK